MSPRRLLTINLAVPETLYKRIRAEGIRRGCTETDAIAIDLIAERLGEIGFERVLRARKRNAPGDIRKRGR